MLKRIWNRFRYNLPENYEPSGDEEFMSPTQLAYFRNRLETWREELLSETAEMVEHLKHEAHYPDITDRASQETERNFELRERDRQRKLIMKINSALARIKDGSYGYCEETGEPISIKRLVARPIATLTIEAQERHEREEKIYNQD
jgi:DnaK suppressor protein